MDTLNFPAGGADRNAMEQAIPQTEARPSMAILQVFLYLQLLDFLTTMLGFRLGLGEASPFVRILTHMGAAFGIALSKFVAVGLAAAAVWLNRPRVIILINYWFAILVVWNLSLMVYAVMR
jgi:hypothetical protein